VVLKKKSVENIGRKKKTWFKKEKMKKTKTWLWKFREANGEDGKKSGS